MILEYRLEHGRVPGLTLKEFASMKSDLDELAAPSDGREMRASKQIINSLLSDAELGLGMVIPITDDMTLWGIKLMPQPWSDTTIKIGVNDGIQRY